MSTSRSTPSTVMLGVLFVAGLVPMGTNVAANWIADAHVFSEWLVGGGVVLSVIVANRSDDMLARSAERVGKAAARWLPWRSGSQTSEQQHPPGA